MADNNFGNSDNFSSSNPSAGGGSILQKGNTGLHSGRSSASAERKAPPSLDASAPINGRGDSDSGEYKRASSAELALNGAAAAEAKSSSSGEMRAVSADSGARTVSIPKLPEEPESPLNKAASENTDADDSKLVKKDEFIPKNLNPEAPDLKFEEESEDINDVDGIELFKSALPQNQTEPDLSPAAAPAPDPEAAAAEAQPPDSRRQSEADGDTAEYPVTPSPNSRNASASGFSPSPVSKRQNDFQTKIIENSHNYSESSDNFDTEEIISSQGGDLSDDKKLKAKPAKKASVRSGGTGRDLFIGIAYFIFLLVLSGIGISWLLTWKNDLDVRPRVSYDQMAWSQNGDTLAFVRTETKLESTGTKQKSALWISDRFGEKIVCLNNDIPVGCQLAGWFLNDSKIILSSPVKAQSEPSASGVTASEPASESDANANTSGRSPSLTPSSMENLKLNSGKELFVVEVDVKSKQTNVFGTGSADLQTVGCNKERIFFADYSNTRKASGHIGIYAWQPGQASDSFKLTAALPSRQDEPLQVQQVAESPDHNKLGIVISIAKSAIKTDEAENKDAEENDAENDTPLGVWIFDKQAEPGENPLSWLNLASHKARDLHIIWAKDSKCLGGIAGHSDFVELFAYHSPSDCPAAKLLGLSEGEHIVPLVFNSDSDELTFSSDHRIDKYNFYMKENRELLSAANLGIEPSNFVISEKSAAAYTATVHNTQNIYICTLNNPNSAMVNITADTAKHTLFYRMVAQLEYAVNYWHNLTMSI